MRCRASFDPMRDDLSRGAWGQEMVVHDMMLARPADCPKDKLTLMMLPLPLSPGKLVAGEP
jgi:hypothetical protein